MTHKSTRVHDLSATVNHSSHLIYSSLLLSHFVAGSSRAGRPWQWLLQRSRERTGTHTRPFCRCWCGCCCSCWCTGGSSAARAIGGFLCVSVKFIAPRCQSVCNGVASVVMPLWFSCRSSGALDKSDALPLLLSTQHRTKAATTYSWLQNKVKGAGFFNTHLAPRGSSNPSTSQHTPNPSSGLDMGLEQPVGVSVCWGCPCALSEMNNVLALLGVNRLANRARLMNKHAPLHTNMHTVVCAHREMDA